MMQTDKSTKWVYYYIRDGLNFVDDHELVSIIKKNVLIDESKGFSENNLMITDYTYALLSFLCEILSRINPIQISSVTKLMTKLIPHSSNAFYYDTIQKIQKLKGEFKILLDETISYRNNHTSIEPEMIHTEFYHIDFLLSMLLFETGKFDLAYDYIDFLKEKYPMPEIYTYYLSAKSIKLE